MSAVETLSGIIRQVMPVCRNPADWAPPLHNAMTRFGITKDKDAVAVFLAQIAVESAEMNTLSENLNYSAERLVAVWPKRFANSVDKARPYAHNSAALANYVYAGRMGNGDAASGDGYKFRGRGLKMITGKDNYKACGAAIGVDLLKNPDHLLTKIGAADSAAWYWSQKGLSPIADDLPNDDDQADFVTITKLINGGTIGLQARRTYWTRAKSALGLP
jgi:putative chitinase